MAPTENFLKAAQAANRQPSVLMRVEDANGAETFYTTKGDWDGSEEIESVQSVTYGPVFVPLGDVAPAYRYYPLSDGAGVLPPPDGGSSVGSTFTSIGSLYVTTIKHLAALFPTAGNTAGTKNTVMQLRTGSALGPVAYTSDIIAVPYILAGSAPNEYFSTDPAYLFANNNVVTFPFAAPPTLIDGTVYYVTCAITGVTGVVEYDMDDTPTSPGATGFFKSYIAIDGVASDSIRIQTSTIDLGGIPVAPVVLSVDDRRPAGTTITYTALGGNTDPPVNDLGTVKDGDSLTAYQYYRIKAVFDQHEPSVEPDGLPSIKEYILTEGSFLDFGTHKNMPISGVKPYLKPDAVSNLTQKITLTKGVTTTGEQTVKMVWLPEVSDMVTTGYVKGKDVAIYAGFVGLDLVDYLPIFVGTWYDNDFSDNGEPVITVKVRDILKQFKKRKLPEETYDANGDKTSAAITYDVENIVTVILDLYDRVGIRDRYIPDDYVTLQNGALSGPDWNVSRVLSKPQSVWKMLNELALTAGLWLTPQGNGQIKPKLYDRNEPADQDFLIKTGVGDFGTVKGNLKEFFSRYYSYYNPDPSLTGDPGGTEDFDNGTALINATAEQNWLPEKGQKEHLDLWKVGRLVAATALTSPPQALRDLNSRWDSWFTEPLYSVPVKNLPPRYAAVDVGAVLPVSGLRLPVANEAWDIATAYLIGAKITYSGRMWCARQDTTGDEPLEGSRYWQDSHILDTGLTDEKRFLVSGRTYNPNRAIIDLDLIEMPPLTRGEVTMAGYASIKIADGSTAQTGITTTSEIMTGWTLNGDSSGLTPDFANNKITIDIAGAYAVNFQNSYSGSALDTMQFHLRVDSVEEPAGAHRKMGSGGDTGSLSFPDVIDLAAGDVVTVWVDSDDAGGADMTPIDAQLVIFQVD